MKILAFDSSAKSASVCVLEDDVILGHFFQNIGKTHSKTLLKMADGLLDNLDLSLEDIDAFSVNYGPGSFTGIRIGVSVVQGLSLGQDKPCSGVSTLESMAYNFKGITDKKIVCLMDARAGQVYNAIFENSGDSLIRITKDRAITLEDLKNELKTLKNSYIFVGDGAKICYNILIDNDIDITLAPEHLLYQNAIGTAYASSKLGFNSVDDLIPIYLRLPQAKREQNNGGNK